MDLKILASPNVSFHRESKQKAPKEAKERAQSSQVLTT